jgi:hypothetical protein
MVMDQTSSGSKRVSLLVNTYALRKELKGSCSVQLNNMFSQL